MEITSIPDTLHPKVHIRHKASSQQEDITDLLQMQDMGNHLMARTIRELGRRDNTWMREEGKGVQDSWRDY